MQWEHAILFHVIGTLNFNEYMKKNLAEKINWMFRNIP